MRMTRWSPLLLIAALPLAACERDADDFDEARETEEFLDMPAPAPAPPVEVAPPEEGIIAAREIEVTNPMPHPMIVTATLDGETIELGTVAADETAEFTVQAPSGATVALEARDEPDTHRVRGTITVREATAAWTIRQ